MSRWNLAWLLGIPAVALLGLAVSYSAPTREKDADYELVHLVVDVLDEVDKHYVRELKSDEKRKLVEDMINGGLEHLDAHSTYMSSKEFNAFDASSKGKFGGIGVQIRTDNSGRLIVSGLMIDTPVMEKEETFLRWDERADAPGPPAYDAGVFAGDVIAKIDGTSMHKLLLEQAIDTNAKPDQPITLKVTHAGAKEPVEIKLTLKEVDDKLVPSDVVNEINGGTIEDSVLRQVQEKAVDLIKGDKGEKLSLTLVREGSKDPVTVNMERAIIKVPTVIGVQRKAGNPREWEYFVDPDQKIAYLRILNFGDDTTTEVRNVLVRVKEQGAKGIILDLRSNPGGLLSSAVDVSNMFLKEGRIVSTKGRNEKEKVYDAVPKFALMVPAEKYPLAILVNRYSASASEIVSAALQDPQDKVVPPQPARAVVVGERSYGKGSVQNILRLDDGKNGALKLTTASYWRPSGHNIHRFPNSKKTDEWGVKPDFEVLVKDEEWRAVERYRSERDLVPGKGAPPKKVEPDKKEEAKKPPEDKVLQKALETLKGKISKPTGGATAPAEGRPASVG